MSAPIFAPIEQDTADTLHLIVPSGPIPRPRRHPLPYMKGRPVAERFLLLSDRSGEHWLWTGSLRGKGYGSLRVNGVRVGAHRVAYELFVGPIPAGYQVDHLCRIMNCVRPSHLEAVPPRENVLRGVSPGAVAQRRDACLYGHAYAQHGVLNCKGARICKLCRDAYNLLYKDVSRDEVARRKREGIPVVDLAAYFATERAA